MTDRLQGEVIGFRQWVVNDDLELASTHIDKTWSPGTNVARCEKRTGGSVARMARFYGIGDPPVTPCEHAPGGDCHCGLYGLHTPSFWYGNNAAPGTIVLPRGGVQIFVAGLVSAWGRLRVHASGFRAEYARVAAIAVPAGRRDAVLARAVAAAYGVPTVPQTEVERIASEFGSTVPSEMRPEPVERQSSFIHGGLWSHTILPPPPIVSAREAYLTLGLTAIDPGYHQPPRAAVRRAPPVPADVARVRARRAAYDPNAFVPKRKGGKR